MQNICINAIIGPGALQGYHFMIDFILISPHSNSRRESVTEFFLKLSFENTFY